jgi:hypothetical protein
MSPARDDRLDEIRHAVEGLVAAGITPTDERIATEMRLSSAELHALMRQLFSEGRRVDGGEWRNPTSVLRYPA